MKFNMIELFKDKGNFGRCSVCNEFLSPNESIVVVEFKMIPPVVIFFHLLHYKKYIDLLKRYITEKEEYYYERFISLNKGEVMEESKIAERLGMEEDFRKDVRDMINYMVYKILRQEKKVKFFCNMFEAFKGIEDCYRCAMVKYRKCSKQFIYSISMEVDKYRTGKEGY